eukprot:jgi/Hompol1/3570/HPOL_003289-RA
MAASTEAKHNVNGTVTNHMLLRSIPTLQVDVLSEEHFESLVKSHPVTVVDFWADWHEPSKDMNRVFEALSCKFPVLSFVRLEAENFPDIAEEYEIGTVPTFLVLR